MRPHLHPLLSALRRNPIGAILVALQISITLAVLVNATAMVSRAIDKIKQPTGLDTRDTFELVVGALGRKFNVASAASADLAYLRALPGVRAATVTFGIPMTADGGSVPLGRTAGGHGATVMSGVMPVDQDGIKALGVRLIAGRNFHADEVTTQSSGGVPHASAEVILTESLARTLFAHGHALGGTVYLGSNTPLTVIGIARNFIGPTLGASPYDTVLVPRISTQYGGYDLLVRARPGERTALLRAVKQHIGAAHQNAIILYATTLARAKDRMSAGLRNTAVFLTVLTAIMITFCSFGIFGLVTFNVGSRTKQIGIRRAVGARRRDIVAHFMSESALVLIAGMALGSLLAFAIGQWLTDHDGVARLNPVYVLTGILGLGLVAQLAAWQPARRAARIAPSVAARTV